MICARCDQPITRGQAYEERDADSVSAAKPPAPIHTAPCARTPRQTAPISR